MTDVFSMFSYFVPNLEAQRQHHCWHLVELSFYLKMVFNKETKNMM